MPGLLANRKSGMATPEIAGETDSASDKENSEVHI